MKTTEQAAKELCPIEIGGNYWEEGFIAGAEWQASQSQPVETTHKVVDEVTHEKFFGENIARTIKILTEEKPTATYQYEPETTHKYSFMPSTEEVLAKDNKRMNKQIDKLKAELAEANHKLNIAGNLLRMKI